MYEELTVSEIPARSVHKTRPQQLLEKFLENYSFRKDDELYTSSEEFVSAMDSAADLLGYGQGPGLGFRYRDVETDYVLGTPSKEDLHRIRFPTLEYYPYLKGTDTLIQILLYDMVLLQHSRIPSRVLMLTNDWNEDFTGEEFDASSLDNAYQNLLRGLTEKIKLKRVTKKDMASKIESVVRDII